jgi:hypothetical protein
LLLPANPAHTHSAAAAGTSLSNIAQRTKATTALHHLHCTLLLANIHHSPAKIPSR